MKYGSNIYSEEKTHKLDYIRPNSRQCVYCHVKTRRKRKIYLL